jgi:hypothetical protein
MNASLQNFQIANRSAFLNYIMGSSLQTSRTTKIIVV